MTGQLRLKRINVILMHPNDVVGANAGEHPDQPYQPGKGTVVGGWVVAQGRGQFLVTGPVIQGSH